MQPTQNPESNQSEPAVKSPSPSNPQKPESIHEHVIEQMMAYESHSGPLPDPSSLKQYEEILPGISHELIKLAVAEMNHRHQVENRIVEVELETVNKEYSEARIGQICGLTFGLALLLVSYLLASQGHQLFAFTTFATLVLNVIRLFVNGRQNHLKNGDLKQEKQIAQTPSTTTRSERRAQARKERRTSK